MSDLQQPAASSPCLPGPIHLDWHQYLTPAAQPVPVERAPTWEIASPGARDQRDDALTTLLRTQRAQDRNCKDFWSRMDERTVALQHEQLGRANPAGAQLVMMKHNLALARARDTDQRRAAQAVRAEHHPVDIVPGLASYKPAQMASLLSPREIETQRPYHRRMARDVVGTQILPTWLGGPTLRGPLMLQGT